MRQIVLDTETTGLEHAQGHRLIEVGCVELINRRLTGRHYHQYINPQREIDAGAMEVHGITNEFVRDKPTFDLVVDEFIEFVSGAELIIHNAPFDIGFINSEFLRLDRGLTPLDKICAITDTLVMARQRHPGQKNNLDALCQRYGIDNSQRDLHGALLDAEILADLYLTMTGGQTALALAGSENSEGRQSSDVEIRRLSPNRAPLRVVVANASELEAHERRLQEIDKASGGQTMWRR